MTMYIEKDHIFCPNCDTDLGTLYSNKLVFKNISSLYFNDGTPVEIYEQYIEVK